MHPSVHQCSSLFNLERTILTTSHRSFPLYVLTISVHVMFSGFKVDEFAYEATASATRLCSHTDMIYKCARAHTFAVNQPKITTVQITEHTEHTAAATALGLSPRANKRSSSASDPHRDSGPMRSCPPSPLTPHTHTHTRHKLNTTTKALKMRLSCVLFCSVSSRPPPKLSTPARWLGHVHEWTGGDSSRRAAYAGHSPCRASSGHLRFIVLVHIDKTGSNGNTVRPFKVQKAHFRAFFWTKNDKFHIFT